MLELTVEHLECFGVKQSNHNGQRIFVVDHGLTSKAVERLDPCDVGLVVRDPFDIIKLVEHVLK
jgi:hypothetical protein